MNPLVVDNIFKDFGDTRAVNGLSFSIAPGECVGLLGSNGAGKSTTIKIISGQVKPSSGSATVFGVDASSNPKEVHQFIGYIPDGQTIYDDITVEQNVEVFRQIYGEPSGRTHEILDHIGMSEKAKAKVKTLSKGQKQRVLLARALVHKPKLILLDEPTTGLDPSSAETIYEILETLKKGGATILLTTHLMNDVERLCDRIVFLNKGEKVEEGTPFDLKQKYRDLYVDVTLKRDGKLSDRRIPFEAGFLEAIAELEKTAPLYSIHTHEPRLEDIFIKLIRRDL